MAPKNAKKQAGGGGGDGEGAQEEPLAAVLLADSFDRRFAPLDTSRSAHRPACAVLRCVAGVALLQLHLLTLSRTGAQQVHILSRTHAAELRHWLLQHPSPAGLRVSVVAAPAAASVGDVLREVDAHGIIRSDFLLVQHDALTSINLAAAVEMHRQRRKRDKDASMTICAAQVGYAASIR